MEDDSMPMYPDPKYIYWVLYGLGMSRYNIPRRRVLKSTGAASALGLVAVPSSAASDETETIVSVRGRNGIARKTEQVPKQWLNRERQALEARRNLHRRFSDQDKSKAVDGIGLPRADEQIAGRFVSDLTVYLDPNAADYPEIPDQQDGIPVSRDFTKSPEPDGCNKTEFDPLPGGVRITSIENDGGGTTTCMVEFNGTYYMMTANHNLDGDDEDNNECTSSTGHKVHQPYNKDQFVGYVDDTRIGEDWAIVPAEGSLSFDNEIEDVVGKLSGHVTQDGLLDLKSSGETVYQQGITTCITEGQVKEVDMSVSPEGCLNSDSHYVRMDTPTDPGDSGGPHYRQYTYNGCTYVAIIAPHYGWDSVGCAAYHINEKGSTSIRSSVSADYGT